MPSHTPILARAAAVTGAAASRGRSALARAALAVGVVAAAAAGTALAGAGPAAAIPGPVVLYAYAGGMAASTVISCPQDAATPPNPAAECSLADALALANPGS